jgi:hypothetical protein
MNEARSYDFRSQETSTNALTAQKLRPISDFAEYVRRYAHERPVVLGVCCFGLGFVLGWKLRPW